MDVLRMVLLLGVHATVVAASCGPNVFSWDLTTYDLLPGGGLSPQPVIHGHGGDIVKLVVNTSWHPMEIETANQVRCGRDDGYPSGYFYFSYLPETMVCVPMNFSAGYSFLAVRRRDAPGIQPAAELRVEGDGFPRQTMQLGGDDVFYSSSNVSLPTKGGQDMITLHYTSAEEEVMIWHPYSVSRGIYTVTYQPDEHKLRLHVADFPETTAPATEVPTVAPSITTGTTTPTTSAPAKSPELHTSTPVVSGTTSSDTGSPTTVAPPTPVPFSASPFTRTAESVAPETVVPTTAPETESPRSSTVDTHTRRTHETTAPALIVHAITAAPTGMPTEPAASNSSKDRGVPGWVWVVVILGIVATVAIVVLLYVARRHHSAQSPSARDFYELTDSAVDPEA